MSSGFTPRELRLLHYMRLNRTLTKRGQNITLSSPLFSIQINKLIRFGFVNVKKGEGCHTYSLTKEGNCLANHIACMVDEEAVMV